MTFCATLLTTLENSDNERILDIEFKNKDEFIDKCLDLSYSSQKISVEKIKINGIEIPDIFIPHFTWERSGQSYAYPSCISLEMKCANMMHVLKIFANIHAEISEGELK